MIVTVLICLIAGAALLQPSASRATVAGILVGIILTHELFFSHLDGLAYFASAALFDLAAIMLTGLVVPITKMVLSIHRICIVSILANFAGWILWEMYFPPLAYELTFAGIYMWTLVVLLKRGGNDVMGDYKLVSRFSGFRGNASAGALRVKQGECEL